MPALHTILVPVDGSPPSIAALGHAVVLAAESGARVDILHVESSQRIAEGSVSMPSPAARQELVRALEKATEGARGQLGERVSRITRSGEPISTIIQTASEGHHDLIVIGTHGRVGRIHAILGSVAEGVVRNAPCPVLTVRESGGGYQSFAERRHGRPTVAEPSPRR